MPQQVGGPGDDLLTGSSGPDELYGLAGNDTLDGGGGNDWLDGGAGVDLMYGGSGDDQYIVNTVGEQVIEKPEEGSDRVFSSVDFVLSANVEELVLTGAANINGTGNSLNNAVFGNFGSNVLDGGAGADTMAGGAGDDFYLVDSAGDVVGEFPGEGIDTVRSSVSFSLAVEVENLILTGNTTSNGTGNDSSNSIIGNDAANILSGRGGNDSLSGGAGADVFHDTLAGHNGDTIEDFTSGDRIIFSDADTSWFSFSLTGNLLTYTGGSLTLRQVPIGPLVSTAAPGGGAQITFADASQDFNGDSRSDLLLRGGQGEIAVWRGQPNGSLVEANQVTANAVDPSWKVVGLGDFNGDGRDDIFWRHSSGVIGEWLGQTGVFTNNSGVAANAVDNSWSVAGIADYNGDGRDDILWHHSSGEIGQWLAQPNGSFANNGGAAANLVDPSWTVVASGDFNGDGRADILWRHTSGVYAEWQGSATGKLNNMGGVMSGATGSVVGSGDFNGDGRNDILMRNASTGALTMSVGQSNGQFIALTPSQQLSDLNWKIVAIGDYNGDGRDDLIWQHSSGAGVEWLGTVAGDFTNNGAIPTVASGWAVQSPDIFLV